MTKIFNIHQSPTAPVNLALNAAFEIDADKQGGVYSGIGYTLDQWRMTGGTSCLRAAVSTNPYGFVVRSTATAANNRFSQRVETHRIKDLTVGSILTLAVDAEVISGSWSASPITCKVDYATAVDNFTSVANVLQTAMTAYDLGSNIPTSTRRRFYHTFVVTQNMITNGFEFGFGDFANATNQVEYSMVLLHAGDRHAEFVRAGIEKTLDEILCKRYYIRFGTVYQSGAAEIGLNIRLNTITFPVEMRIAPSFFYQDGIANQQSFSIQRVGASGQTHGHSFGGWAGSNTSANYGNSGNAVNDAHTWIFENVRASARQ